MIRTFHDRATEVLFETGRHRHFRSCERRCFQKLRMLDAAGKLSDMGSLPGNRLESLKGDRRGQHSIRVNDQYRICFRWQDGDAFGVEITDYH